jgi:hypothetical protein
MKKWFWVIGCDNTHASAFVADACDLGGYDDQRFRVCEKVDAWPGTAWVKATTPAQDGNPDDALQTCLLSVPVFSSRLRSAVAHAGITGVQYLPIQVVRPHGELIPGFSVANVLNCVDALDQRLSVISRFPDDYFIPSRRGVIRGINSAVLVDSIVAPYDILRLSTYKIQLYVSDRFVQAFEAAGLTGFSFREVSTSSQ